MKFKATKITVPGRGYSLTVKRVYEDERWQPKTSFKSQTAIQDYACQNYTEDGKPVAEQWAPLTEQRFQDALATAQKWAREKPELNIQISEEEIEI